MSRTSSWHSPNRRRSGEYQPLALSRIVPVYSNLDEAPISGCSQETNTRLYNLHEQLHSLISKTVEHTRGCSLSDDESGFEDAGSTGSGLPLRRTPRQRPPKDESRGMLDSETWTHGGDFSPEHTPTGNKSNPMLYLTGRASVAKLRTQNAGMVLAKAKLFDETSAKITATSTASPQCEQRQDFAGQSQQRNKAKSKAKDVASSPGSSKRSGKSSSPKSKLKLRSPQAPLASEANVDADGYKTPRIKKPLMMKSPKSAKIARRPAVEIRRTPMKAVPIMSPKKERGAKLRYPN